MKKLYNTGLVLSGGGTRGFAHLGVIAALYKRGVVPDIISGVSAGAIVGAFIAGGRAPEEIFHLFNKKRLSNYTNFQLPGRGLFALNGLQRVIKNEIPYKNIEDLITPLIVCVSNLKTGEVEYLKKGSIGKVVLASSSIPILFSPVEIDDQLYVDGGLLDNIPVKPLINICENIISVNISPVNFRKKFKSIKQVAVRTFYMSINSNLDKVKEISSIFIEPKDIDDYDIFSMGNAHELYNLGYQAVEDINFTAINTNL